MKREIKFRAWIAETKQKAKDFENHYDISELNNDFFIVNQFTGLKDINRIEIYEGDIIREWIEDLVLQENGFWWYGIVAFKNGQWKVLQSDFNYIDFDDMSKLYEDFEFLEVVGNIYESPELLNPKSKI